MKGTFCPNCEEFTDVRLETTSQVLNIRGKPIEIKGEVAICQACGAKVFNEELDSRNLEEAYVAYREKYKLLSPDEIRTTREKYGLSQRALSRLLGWGDITIHRYESGAIQDKVHDSTLRLIEDPQTMQKIFETSRGKLTSYTAKRLEETIATFLQEDNEQTFRASFERMVAHPYSDLTSGYKKYDLEKLENMIFYLLKRLNGDFITKLNKTLWYCDFLHFRETSVSISGAQYLHLQYGPVPNNYDLITGMMLHERLLDKEEIVFDVKEDIVGEKLIALVEPDASMFSEKEIEVINFVSDTFRDYTATMIKNKSHQETACIKSEDGEIISYKYANELSLSLPN